MIKADSVKVTIKGTAEQIATFMFMSASTQLLIHMPKKKRTSFFKTQREYNG